ncbi:FAD/FMN-containing dehydrogenase [Paenibacillus marinisediminis]
MKKQWAIASAVVLTFAFGTGAYAAANWGGQSFEDMKPHMQQMHPTATNQQLEEMYNDCHSDLEQSPAMMDRGHMNRMNHMMSNTY